MKLLYESIFMAAVSVMGYARSCPPSGNTPSPDNELGIEIGDGPDNKACRADKTSFSPITQVAKSNHMDERSIVQAQNHEEKFEFPADHPEIASVIETRLCDNGSGRIATYFVLRPIATAIGLTSKGSDKPTRDRFLIPASLRWRFSSDIAIVVKPRDGQTLGDNYPETTLADGPDKGTRVRIIDVPLTLNDKPVQYQGRDVPRNNDLVYRKAFYWDFPSIYFRSAPRRGVRPIPPDKKKQRENVRNEVENDLAGLLLGREVSTSTAYHPITIGDDDIAGSSGNACVVVTAMGRHGDAGLLWTDRLDDISINYVETNEPTSPSQWGGAVYIDEVGPSGYKILVGLIGAVNMPSNTGNKWNTGVTHLKSHWSSVLNFLYWKE
jgi:hypothetical protein